MRFPLGIGEHATITNPETGEPVTVRLTAGDEGRLILIVEAVPGSAVKVTAPATQRRRGVSVQGAGLPQGPLSSAEPHHHRRLPFGPSLVVVARHGAAKPARLTD